VQDVATVARTQVHQDAIEGRGYCADLTHVDLDELLAYESTHAAMVVPGTARPPPL
jgi:hypothetical protein